MAKSKFAENINTVTEAPSSLTTRPILSNIFLDTAPTDSHTIIGMFIDVKGELGGGSDHNWILLDIEDSFPMTFTKPLALRREKKVRHNQVNSSR